MHTALPAAILYLPTAQEVHVPPFGPVKPTLHVQAERLELPPGELELVGQNRQNPALEAPTNVWYVPEKQLLHVKNPVMSLYFPATHAVHVPPFGPVKPMLHVQAARAELEIGELELVGHARQAVATVAPVVVKYVPAAQSVHAAEPVAILYLPTAQAVHVPLLGPVNPTLQVQLASALQPLHEAPALAGHARQVVATVAPVVVEYVPAPQSVHAAEPVALLYFPGTHRGHVSRMLVYAPFCKVAPALQVHVDVLPSAKTEFAVQL